MESLMLWALLFACRCFITWLCNWCYLVNTYECINALLILPRWIIKYLQANKHQWLHSPVPSYIIFFCIRFHNPQQSWLKAMLAKNERCCLLLIPHSTCFWIASFKKKVAGFGAVATSLHDICLHYVLFTCNRDYMLEAESLNQLNQ